MPTSDLSPKARRQVATWLFTVCALIFAMVVLGGVTRLTRSGLSIVDWKPILGILPPLSEAEWQAAFDAYKQFPEYQKINLGMDLDGFKSIFWFEYWHRVLGRVIGLAFFFPLVYFWLRGMLSRALAPKLVIMFILGGLQGGLGWYMVKSGLVDVPHVSPYRLTAHLSLAIGIFGYMMWVALGLVLPASSYADKTTGDYFKRRALALLALIGLMIVSGGFVAGTKAGYAYNTFPTMNGFWFPPGLYEASPFYRNFFENLTTVQFNHRLLAYIIVGAIIALVIVVYRSTSQRSLRLAIFGLLAAMGIQVTLGISTLLSHMAIPIAAAHQGGALILLSATIILVRLLVPGRPE